MDTFDQRRTISLVFGLVALGLALAVTHVNERRAAATQGQPAPIEASLTPGTRG